MNYTSHKLGRDMVEKQIKIFVITIIQFYILRLKGTSNFLNEGYLTS